MLTGRSVVVCRATHQATPVIERLVELDADVVHVPLIEVVGAFDGGAELRRALAEITSSTWLTFTSANGVDAVATQLDGRAPKGRLAVVGGATARQAEAHGWSIDFVSPASSASGLGKSLPVVPGDRVVAPLAELASNDLSDALQSRGVEVDVVTAYRTIQPDVSVDDQRRIASSDAVLITAPSVIERLAALMNRSDLPALFAIGPTSAAAIRAAGLDVAGEADVPTVDGLIEATLRTLQG